VDDDVLVQWLMLSVYRLVRFLFMFNRCNVVIIQLITNISKTIVFNITRLTADYVNVIQALSDTQSYIEE